MKWIAPVLVVCLVLCGCAPSVELTAAPPPDTVPVIVTEPAGIYDPASAIEQLTQGAIKVYPLGPVVAAGMAPMGSGILLFSGAENTTLTRLGGENLHIAATAELNCKITPADPAVQISDSGITYFDPLRKELVFLDAQLKDVRRVPLPETICGSPALCADLQTVYYCTADALRCLDLETNLDRLVKEMHFEDQTAAALHCHDTVIACDAQTTDGTVCRLYISTETGLLLYEAREELQLQTHGTSYFAVRMDGIYPELLVGDSEQGPTLLTPPVYDCAVFPLLGSGAAVTVTMNPADGTTQLDYYDLHSGRRTAGISLHGLEPIRSVISSASPYVWFTRYDPSCDCDVLCCWDTAKSAVSDSRHYFSARYSFDHPDWDGLVDCRLTAEELSRKYGVRILLWTDAILFQPPDYTLVPEYQVPVIRENLKELERFLSMFPAGFLQKAAERSESGQIRICLVRRILGNGNMDGTLKEAAGLQYWDRNANPYLCLAVRQENLFRNAWHEMSHIIDSRVLTVCRAYDSWNSLNPEGFQYNYAAVTDLPIEDRRWTVGPNRAFLDLYSMTYPREDRARIMEFAVEEGFAASFESEIMQKKLRTLCLGIRQAFDLQDSPEIFPWEQYLKTPLNQK